MTAQEMKLEATHHLFPFTLVSRTSTCRCLNRDLAAAAQPVGILCGVMKLNKFRKQRWDFACVESGPAMVWADTAVSREYFTALPLLQPWACRIAASAALSASAG